MPYTFEFPLLAAPMDSVDVAGHGHPLGRLGGLGVLNLEGLWTRYEDPRAAAGEIIARKPTPSTRPAGCRRSTPSRSSPN